MARPVILSVDDDVQVLASVERDLRDRYGDDYRVLTAPSGAEALEALTELQRRGTPIALLVADQRMPGMEGTEFLEVSRPLAPDARRVLLTAYADLEVLIDAVNSGAVDRYVQKPWDSKEFSMILKQGIAHHVTLRENRRMRPGQCRQGWQLEDHRTRGSPPHAGSE